MSAPARATVNKDESGNRIERHYDDQGLLDEVTFYDYTVEPTHIERLRLSRNPDVRVRSTIKGKIEIRRETERYARPGVLDEREVLVSSNEDGKFDRRTLMKYHNFQVKLEEFEAVAGAEGKWKRVAASEAPATGSKSAKPRGSSFDKYLAACAKEKPELATDTCRKVLGDLPLDPERIKNLTATDYANLECIDKTDKIHYLPNGYAIDLKSCARGEDSEKKVKQLLDASATASGQMRACLSKLNPKLEEKVSRLLRPDRTTQLTLYCAGTEGRLPSDRFCEAKKPKYDQCRKDFDRHRSTSDAFFSTGHPGAIFLTGADPHSDGAGAATLDSTIFHETLHAADTPENARHSETPPFVGDAVYGCESLCGPAPNANLSSEGCSACLTAAGNKPGADALKQCAKFPKAALIQLLQNSRKLSIELLRCEAELDSAGKDSKAELPSCKALTHQSGYKNACGKKTFRDEACRSALRRHAGLLVTRAFSEHDPAQVSDYIARSALKLAQHTLDEAGQPVAEAPLDPENPGKGVIKKLVTHWNEVHIVVDGFCAEVLEGGRAKLDAAKIARVRKTYDREVRFTAPVIRKNERALLPPVWGESYASPASADVEATWEYCATWNTRGRATFTPKN